MADNEETRLKAEIDHIVKSINETIRKIERVVPFNEEAADQPSADEMTGESTQPPDKS